MTTCTRCNRALKSEESRRVGYGPVCWAKVQAEVARWAEGQEASIVIETKITDGYAGARDRNGNVKVVRIRNGQQEPLEGRWHHTGFTNGQFNWGYGGSGPAYLARSIIADAFGISDPHPAVYQAFKWSFVSGWGNRWEISIETIREWAQKNNLLAQVK